MVNVGAGLLSLGFRSTTHSAHIHAQATRAKYVEDFLYYQFTRTPLLPSTTHPLFPTILPLGVGPRATMAGLLCTDKMLLTLRP
jgi:hypothetical protein